MKIILFLFCSSLCFSQSPYFSIKFSITTPGPVTRDLRESFSIKYKVCNFKFPNEAQRKEHLKSGDYWFGNDTSDLSWDALPDSVYNYLNCTGEMFSNGRTFEAGDQGMIWEDIFSFKIIRDNIKENTTDTMTIVFPVLIKSFVSIVDLGNFEFHQGYFELTHELIYDVNPDTKRLKITLKNNPEWKALTNSERKIKLQE